MKFYVVDAYRVAREAEMGVRINTVMQTCFFKLAGVHARGGSDRPHQARRSKRPTANAARRFVNRNFAAVDGAISALHEVKVPGEVTSKFNRLAGFQGDADEFVKGVLGEIMSGNGDELPVSAMPVDGTFPTATTQYEKRSIALDIPIWDKEICIQCGLCSLGCPHAAIRMKAYPPEALAGAPEGFESMEWKGKEYPGWKMSIQVAPDDCTGCGLCIDVCPAKNREVAKRKAINMESKLDHLEKERANYDFFLSIPDVDRTQVKADTIKGSQLLLPLFEYSGACAGCGETPYVKLITQFFGDRMLISNATGCSSIYGGNLPSTPYCVDANGRGPSWSNSLFEDNAEFGFGFRLAIDQQIEYAGTLLKKLSGELGDNLVGALLSNKQETEEEIAAQRKAVAELKTKLAGMGSQDAKDLLASSDYLARRSVWILGGDGWAYDIGYGGLDHVFASGRDVNILVLDTEVYSNTGGQASKATPRGAVAKFAAGGKPAGKKDLGMMAMSYGNVYVGQISLGANPNQAIKAIRAAEAYRGTSLIIAYAHCIAHGINMTTGMGLQKEAVACGYWPLYRFDPNNEEKPFSLDSKAPKGAFKDFAMQQARYAMLARAKPEDSERLVQLGQEDINRRWETYEHMAAATRNGGEKEVQA